jgi:hypothetical protein
VGLEDAERSVGGLADVAGDVVLDPPLQLAPRLLVPRVHVPEGLVDDLGVVGELAELEDQHPGMLAIDEQHPDGLVVVEHGLELADRGGPADDQLVADGQGQGQRRPEALRLAGEHRQPPRAGAVDPGRDVALDGDEVGPATGALPVGPGQGVAHEAVQLLLVLRPSGEAPPVHVEVAAGDHARPRAEGGQLADLVVGEGGGQDAHPRRVGPR